jgi:hypothetical protein
LGSGAVVVVDAESSVVSGSALSSSLEQPIALMPTAGARRRARAGVRMRVPPDGSGGDPSSSPGGATRPKSEHLIDSD